MGVLSEQDYQSAVFGVILSHDQTLQIQDENNKCTNKSRNHSSKSQVLSDDPKEGVAL